MTQKQIEALEHEEYCHLLSYGDPLSNDTHSHCNVEDEPAWISTLESTTYPDLTFGYIATL